MTDQFIKRYPFGQDSGLLDYPGQGGANPGAGTSIIPEIALSSGAYATTAEATALFDGSAVSGYGNNNVVPYLLTFKMAQAVRIERIKMYRSSTQSGGWTSDSYSPKHFKFYGSNDPTVLANQYTHVTGQWTELNRYDNQIIPLDSDIIPAGTEIPDSKFTDFPVFLSGLFQYYRLRVNSSHATQWGNITEMKLIQL